MSRLDTKAARLQAQQSRIDYLTGQGYTREDYKELIILTRNWKREDGQGAERFFYCVFKGTAAMEMEHKYCSTLDHRNEVIKKFKEGHDRLKAWKAEQKEANKGKSSSHAAASAAVKEELTKAFPGIKFSCRSESFSMGDAVRIEWTNGPTTAQVEAISSKYQSAQYDSHADYWDTSENVHNVPRAKYVTTRRNRSEEIDAFAPQLQELLDQRFSGLDKYRDSGEQVLFRLFYQSEIPVGAKVIGVEYCEDKGGHGVENHFQLITEGGTPQPKTKEDRTEQPTAGPVETEAGEVKIIDYSARAIAVIGDTKPIKDKLKEMGGKFNFRLTCGAGWIFPKTKMDEVVKGISEVLAKEITQEVKSELKAAIEEETPTAEEKSEPEPATEIQNKYDKAGIKIYDNLQDIEKAAESGKVISLLNLFDLCNQKRPGSAAM